MRFIEPRRIIENRLNVKELPTYDTAILIFRDQYASSLIKYNLHCKPLNQKVLYGIDPNNTHEIISGKYKILVIEQVLWGGPQTAILIEELFEFGVRLILGIGACGSLTERLRKNDVVVDSEALITDGTSKFYTKEKSIKPDKDLITFIKDKEIKTAISTTIDALYQETKSVISNFQKMGAEIINMESATFYAVTKKYKIDAVWIGCVSDELFEHEWTDWYNSKDGTVNSGKAALRIIKKIISAR